MDTVVLQRRVRSAWKDFESARGPMEDALSVAALARLQPEGSRFASAMCRMEEARDGMVPFGTEGDGELLDAFAARVSTYGDELEFLGDALVDVRNKAESGITDIMHGMWDTKYDQVYSAVVQLHRLYSEPTRDIDALTTEYGTQLRAQHSKMSAATDDCRGRLRAISQNIEELDTALTAYVQLGHVRILALTLEKALADLASHTWTSAGRIEITEE